MRRRDFISGTIAATAFGTATAVAGERIRGINATAQNVAAQAGGNSQQSKGEASKLRTICLEEHFGTPAYFETPGGRGFKEAALRAKSPNDPGALKYARLSEIGERRIADMDAARIDVQVLSFNSPGVEQLPADQAVAMSREANDYLADCIKKHPTRFAGYASVPTPAPEQAAKEFERVVTQYGFKGANINGHNQGRYLDDKRYWPILETAVALKVPIYIHPTPPPKAVIDAYYGGFDRAMTSSLTQGGWGWHIETGVHVIRLMLAGVFDRYPTLQVVIGHMGEVLPYMLSRMDRQMTMSITKLQRPISAYLRENVHYTFSGFTFTPTFLDMMLQVGVDRIMFSCDYPMQSMDETRVFLDELPVSDIDRERIAHGNAERLFRM